MVPMIPLAALVGIGWFIGRQFGEHAQNIYTGILMGLIALIFAMGVISMLWEHLKRIASPYMPPDIKE